MGRYLRLDFDLIIICQAFPTQSNHTQSNHTKKIYLKDMFKVFYKNILISKQLNEKNHPWLDEDLRVLSYFSSRSKDDREYKKIKIKIQYLIK